MSLVAPKVQAIPLLPVAEIGADPAADVEFSVSVPAGEAWELRAVTVELVQGATQTPLPSLVVDDGTTVVCREPGSTAAQAVSTTARYTWAPGRSPSGQIGTTPNIASVGSLPPGLVLKPGWRVRSITQGKGANTDYGAPVLHVVKHKLAG